MSLWTLFLYFPTMRLVSTYLFVLIAVQVLHPLLERVK
jgi:hypothetical protein